jgi:3-dehydroquinate dehydratase/shikimate dehydrogenase
MVIVATYVPDPAEDPRQAIACPPAGAHLVELRADLLPAGTDPAELVKASPLPVVVTLRSRAEGGQGPIDEDERRRFFERAVCWPVAFWDLEASRDGALLGAVVPRDKAIWSAHLTNGAAAQLEEQAAEMLGSGARFVKIVPTVSSLAETLAVLRLAQALDHGKRSERRAVVFAAGESGRVTRLLSPLYGAPLAYAAWSRERAAAPGQLVPEDLLALIGHLQGRPRRLFAVLGSTVGRSLSPRMHNAAFRELGLPHLFVPIEVGVPAELDVLIAPLGETALDELGVPAGGYAVTMPWKERAATRCTMLAPRAERAGAANTVLPRPGKVLGDCTDIDGITRVLAEEGVDLGKARALVLGAGGAARAAAVGLDLAGAEVALVGRDAGKVAAVAKRLGLASCELDGSDRFDVVVNATPAGSDGVSDPMLEGLRVPAESVVVDLPYGSAPTFLEQLAARRQWRFVGGREVLLYQGVAQFAAMNGVAPPVRAMAAALGLEEVVA